MSSQFSKLIIISITLISVITYSQSKQWQFYSAEYKNLPSSNVKTIAVDDKGIAWFGTDSGFASYDGAKWKQFKMRDYNLPDSVISRIVIDKNNCKWMATSNGLIKYNDTSITVFNTNNSKLPSNYIVSLAIDDSNNVWVATWTTIKGALSKIRGSILTTIPSPYIVLSDMKFDRHGNLWIAAQSDGLIKYNKSDLTQYTFQGKRGPVNMRRLAIDTSGAIWLGTYADGIAKFQDGGLITYDIVPGTKTLSTSAWEAIACDDKGNIIINSDSGIVRFNKDTCTFLFSQYAHYAVDDINTIIYACDESLWIGSIDIGVFKYKGGSWENFDASYGLPNNAVYSVLVDKNNIKWIGTYEGLASYDGQEWKTYNVFNSSLPGNSIGVLEKDKHGSIWIGTSRGLVKHTGITWEVYTKDNSGLLDNRINCIRANEDTLWVGTDLGLSKWDGKTWTNYTHANSGLLEGSIGKVDVDKTGNKWLTVGSYTAPVVKYDGKHWIAYNKDNSAIKSDEVNTICVDNQNGKWFGTSTDLVFYNDSTWQVYNKANTGVVLNDTYRISIDNNGNVVLGIYWGNGIVVYDGINWKYFNAVTPLLNVPINAYDICVDKYNNKWIAIDYGLAVFNENGIISSAKSDFESTPKQFTLFQNYPNPFNPSTKISYHIAVSGNVQLRVYDIQGNKVATLVNKFQQAGNYTVDFSSIKSGYISSGVYFYSLSIGCFCQTKKMLLLK